MNNKMVYGVCWKCQRKIEVEKPTDPWLAKVLDGAAGECNECEPKSHWRVVVT